MRVSGVTDAPPVLLQDTTLGEPKRLKKSDDEESSTI
jgi:hypothetical protein